MAIWTINVGFCCPLPGQLILLAVLYLHEVWPPALERIRCPQWLLLMPMFGGCWSAWMAFTCTLKPFKRLGRLPWLVSLSSPFGWDGYNQEKLFLSGRVTLKWWSPPKVLVLGHPMVVVLFFYSLGLKPTPLVLQLPPSLLLIPPCLGFILG